MSREILRLILLISCAHAMVHVYEFSFPSVELLVQEELGVDATSIGVLATAWALPFGLGAVAAGWLADRFGPKRILVIYLFGCGLMSAAAAVAPSYWTLLGALLLMGSFASLYHPAGLSLISHVTTSKNRGMALGYHGVLGSAGIAGGPLVAAIVLNWTSWRLLYWWLLLPGLVLGLLLWKGLQEVDRHTERAKEGEGDSGGRLGLSFALLCVITAQYGFIYRAFATFLPRYLDAVGFETAGVLGWSAGLREESLRNYLAAGVLAIGIAGQFWAGHLAGRFRLEPLLVAVLACNVPFLIWMGQADHWQRLVATGGFAFVHFMMQPVGNCLIAKHSPSRRRSLGYGISFLLSFGLGSTGGAFAGWIEDRFGILALYPALAAVALLAASIAIALWVVDGKGRRAAEMASRPT